MDGSNPNIYAYTRELDGKKMLILLNFTKETATANTAIDLSKAKVIYGNYPKSAASNQLKPYEAMILELQ